MVSLNNYVQSENIFVTKEYILLDRDTISNIARNEDAQVYDNTLWTRILSFL